MLSLERIRRITECFNNLKQGDIVVSFPVTFDEQGVHGIGFSNKYPGGYSERIVINEMMSIKVPNGL